MTRKINDDGRCEGNENGDDFDTIADFDIPDIEIPDKRPTPCRDKQHRHKDITTGAVGYRHITTSPQNRCLTMTLRRKASILRASGEAQMSERVPLQAMMTENTARETNRMEPDSVRF
ncbi:hypothetical protein BaRGS_00010527 [Batillaria attramentaria]|uniref:Uncharacterized protein n=1 Tax=Batillaria attramentaria TaxID=370345 RepID=A0ABD0LGT4_9CAEN